MSRLLGDHWQLYKDSYSLEFTKRYSMRLVNHQESVASHSYFVCLALMLLIEDYNFELGDALQMAVAHDIPEIAVSDVNHFVKRQFPAVAKELKIAEATFAESLPPTLRAAYTAHLSGSKEAQFVEYADTLQVVQYAMLEVRMGNVFMREVVDQALARCEQHEARLRPYLYKKD